jgi:hypothetical protein
MTSPEPTASVEAFSALAMAIKTIRRALKYRRAECLGRAGYVGGQPSGV